MDSNIKRSFGNGMIPEDAFEVPDQEISQQQRSYISAIGSDPLSVQVGGGHYKTMAIQPVEYITKNNLGYCEANVVKYISRWRDKGGKKDLEKAKHYIDLLIQLESL